MSEVNDLTEKQRKLIIKSKEVFKQIQDEKDTILEQRNNIRYHLMKKNSKVRHQYNLRKSHIRTRNSNYISCKNSIGVLSLSGETKDKQYKNIMLINLALGHQR